MNDPVFSRILQRHLARRQMLVLAGSLGAGAALTACGGKSPAQSGTAQRAAAEGGGSPTGQQDVTRPAGWSEDSHGKDAPPDYGTVFPADKVIQVAITVSPENWQKMLDDMTALFGERGTGRGRSMPGGAPEPGAQPGGIPPGGVQQGGPGAGGGDFTSTNPIWVPGTVAFSGRTWTNVGIRFKGNSTLANGWRSGTDKLPLKLDFDEFEGDYPEIENQRFYGFKQFSLSNNQNDQTFMRETVAYDLLDEAGLAAANTAPWQITLDRGEGPKVLGIYTAIEVVDDTVISRCFKDASGNIYEGDGRAASFAAGTQSLIESSFQAEGGDDPDWSDIRALYDAIHAATRTSDAAAWRKGLEKVFDVDAFLEWLAIAATLQHWDTYGAMTHNYYLYNNPENGKLTWISWDHNEVLGSGFGGGGGNPQVAPGGGAQGALPAGGLQPGGGGMNRNVAFDKSGVGSGWPLIRYVLDQPDYLQRYNGYLRETVKLFDPARLAAKYQQYAAVIKPYVSGEVTEANFAAAVQTLTNTTQARAAALKAYVDSL